jgi:hypothetical protein
MPHNFSAELYALAMDEFARPVTFATGGFTGRGIYNTEKLDVAAEDGSIISSQRTILDILEVEFAVLPQQRDQLTIPADDVGNPALGDFEITDVFPNGGGETTLVLRKLQTAP